MLSLHSDKKVVRRPHYSQTKSRIQLETQEKLCVGFTFSLHPKFFEKANSRTSTNSVRLILSKRSTVDRSTGLRGSCGSVCHCFSRNLAYEKKKSKAKQANKILRMMSIRNSHSYRTLMGAPAVP